MAHRPHPHIAIPPEEPPPHNLPPSSRAFASPLSPPLNLWADRRHSAYTPPAPDTSYPRISLDVPSRPPSRATSAYEAETSHITFPEPQLQLHRSSSQRSSYRPSSSVTLGHRSTRSDLVLSPSTLTAPTIPTGESRPPSFESTPELVPKELSDELSNLTLDSEEGLHRFQVGELPESSEEWHLLVPPEALDVLDKTEIKRQSVLFEIIKSERDYVSDLELLKEVFIDPLINTSAVPKERVRLFVQEVFHNLDHILAHHQRMLAALFNRQREQHPLIQSVADIILDTSLLFRNDYEDYIKHYPLAEACHRAELRRAQKYQYFIQQCSLDPRVRKRDLITFLSRPVTRLPRLALLLENALKATDADHPDMETIPLILGILRDFIKSTQPGIVAAEGKVKFWNLCENLVYERGEIMDMDLYDESRTLVYRGELARRYKQDVWADLNVALFDNYLLMLKDEIRSSSVTKHKIISRPIPLEYLCIEGFDDPPVDRKEKAEESGNGRSIFESFRPRYRKMYPFIIYHASARISRRYFLHARSEAIRVRWRDALVDAIGVRKARQDANKWFASQVINEGYFKYSEKGATYSGGAYFTGKITAAARFSSKSKHFIAIACPSGVYVAELGSAAFRKVISVTNPTCILALPEANQFLVLHDLGLFAYPLDLLVRVSMGLSPAHKLDSSVERVADSSVLFFRAGRIGSRTVVMYAAKRLMQIYVYALEVSSEKQSSSFGEPLSALKDIHNITALPRFKWVALCTEKTIYMADPTNLSLSGQNLAPIPNFRGVENNEPMAKLKTKCSAAKPLGLVRVEGSDEMLVIYDEHGCYIDRHGVPSRSSGYLRWESKAISYTHRGGHIFLFSPEFIEIRTANSGKLVQVIEGADIRLGNFGSLSPDTVTLVAMRGKNSPVVTMDKIVELQETAAIDTRPQESELQALWAEFDTYPGED